MIVYLTKEFPTDNTIQQKKATFLSPRSKKHRTRLTSITKEKMLVSSGTCTLEVYLSRAASQLQLLIAEIVALKAAIFSK